MSLANVETADDKIDVARANTILRWNRETFLAGDPTHQPCPPVLDITGKARFLFFGPYIALPPGVWRASVSLDLSEDASRCQLAVQFGAEPDYSTVDLVVGRVGRQDIEIEHGFKEGDLAQVRLWLKRAAFLGDLRLLGVTARPLGPNPPSGRC